MSPAQIALIMGLAVVIVGVLFGYILSKLRDGERPDARIIAGVLIGLMVGVTLLASATGDDGDSGSIDLPADVATVVPQDDDSLSVGDTLTRTLNADEGILLPYNGEQGEIVTLRVEPPTDTPIVIVTLITSRGERVPRTVQTTQDAPDSNQLCGYELPENARYSFGFTANAAGDYTVHFERGDTCEG